MASVTFFGEHGNLAQRLKAWGQNSDILVETQGWTQFKSRLKKGFQGSDLLVLDLTAPTAPGLERTGEITIRNLKTPVLYLITAKHLKFKPLEQALQSPKVDFVYKPFQPTEIYRRIQRLVSISHPHPHGGPPPKPDSTPLPAAGRAMNHWVPELHSPTSGRLDAKRIGSLFGLPLAEIARILKRDLSAVHKTPDAVSIQSKLALFERLAVALLHLVGSPEGLRIWLNSTNPDLENKTPLSFIKQGKGKVIAELLEDELMGQPG